MPKIGFLIENDFHDSEMQNPYDAIKKEGHEVVVIGAEKGAKITAKQGTITYTADASIDEISADDLDGIVIPGGKSPERVRINDKMVQLVKDISDQGKLIAGICHGQQVMISADVLKGRKATCYIGIRDDVKLAGAEYTDEEVVVDNNFVTSRNPNDEPAFIREILRKLN